MEKRRCRQPKKRKRKRIILRIEDRG